MPRYDQLLDLRGALVYPEEPRVPVETFDRDPSDVARAAMDLYRTVGDPADHLAAEVLRRGRPDLGVATGVKSTRGLDHQGAAGVQIRHRVGDHALDELVVPDGPTALVPLRRPGHRLIHQALRETHTQRGDVDTAVGEAAHGGREAVPRAIVPTDEMGVRNTYLVEVHV